MSLMCTYYASKKESGQILLMLSAYKLFLEKTLSLKTRKQRLKINKKFLTTTCFLKKSY
jgi:hypothetical protein